MNCNGPHSWSRSGYSRALMMCSCQQTLTRTGMVASGHEWMVGHTRRHRTTCDLRLLPAPTPPSYRGPYVAPKPFGTRPRYAEPGVLRQQQTASACCPPCLEGRPMAAAMRRRAVILQARPWPPRRRSWIGIKRPLRQWTRINCVASEVVVVCGLYIQTLVVCQRDVAEDMWSSWILLPQSFRSCSHWRSTSYATGRTERCLSQTVLLATAHPTP